MCRKLPFISVILLFATLVAAQESTVTTQVTSSVVAANFTTTTSRNFNDIQMINDLLDVFNIAHLGAQWSSVQGTLSKKCADDMTLYFQGLEKRKLWALKSKFKNIFNDANKLNIYDKRNSAGPLNRNANLYNQNKQINVCLNEH